MGIIVNAMLGGELLRWLWPCLSGIDLTEMSFQVIMIIRLQAMYQRSRKMLIFLVVVFLAIQTASVLISIIQDTGGRISGGKHQLRITDLSASD